MLSTTIIKENAGGFIRSSLEEELFQKRQIILSGEITPESALETAFQLKYLSLNSYEPVTIYIDSPGGAVQAGYTIIDEIKRLQNQGITVNTVVQGVAASFGALISACGTKGFRYCYPHSRIMIHDPLCQGLAGSALQIEHKSKELMQIRSDLAAILAECTGHSIKEILKMTSKGDRWFSAKHAVEYGLADAIVE